jgi:hypothetical protein
MRIAVALSFASCALATVAAADESFRCHDHLVVTGLSRVEVRALCGAPASAERRDAVRARRRLSILDEDAGPVVFERWVYDFGPNDFVHYLDFENDTLAEISTGRYGSAKRAPGWVSPAPQR